MTLLVERTIEINKLNQDRRIRLTVLGRNLFFLKIRLELIENTDRRDWKTINEGDY